MICGPSEEDYRRTRLENVRSLEPGALLVLWRIKRTRRTYYSKNFLCCQRVIANEKREKHPLESLKNLPLWLSAFIILSFLIPAPASKVHLRQCGALAGFKAANCVNTQHRILKAQTHNRIRWFDGLLVRFSNLIMIITHLLIGRSLH